MGTSQPDRKSPGSAPSKRARLALLLLLSVVLLAGVGLFWWGRSTPPVAAASPPAPTASVRKWHPRSSESSAPVRGSRPGASQAEVRGRVVAEGGGPIAGASVILFQGQESFAELVSDEQGSFAAVARAGQVKLMVSAPDHVTAYETVFLPRDFAREPFIIELARGAVLTGQVVREDTGEPVPGARVNAAAQSGEGIDEDWVVDADEAGRYRIEGLDAGEFKPSARARGLFGQASAAVVLAAGETSAPVTIRVRRVATLRARLELAPTHVPCAEGTLRFTSEVYGDFEAPTGVDGSVVLDAVPAGIYEVRLSCEDHVDEEHAPPLTVGDVDMDVVFSLHEKLAIHGSVVTPGGELVPEVWVTASRVPEASDEHALPSALSDEDGQFVLRDLEAGTYELAAADGLDAAKVLVTVREGAPPPEVRLVRDVVPLRGRVVDPRGEPIAQAGVSASRDPSGNGSFMTDVDRDGRFSIEHFGPGTLTLKVSIGGVEVPLQGGVGVLMLPVAGQVTLVALTPEGVIDGHVVGGTGPRAGIAIDGTCSGHQRASAETDAAGHFVLRHLTPGGTCAAFALAGNGESARVAAVDIGAQVELTLRPAARLRGTVRNAPLAFSLSVSGNGYNHAEVFFATQGAWDVPRLPAGDYTVTVQTDTEHGSAKGTLAPGEERSIEIVLRPGANADDDEEEEGESE